MIPKAIRMEIRHIVALLISFILYVLFGGMVFMWLEGPAEQIKRREIEFTLKEFDQHIIRLNRTDFTTKDFRRMLHDLLVAADNNLIDNYGNERPNINWSFINSFFFAITVITTIGYGHLTPSTVSGKMFCIIYALFGIPITSLLIGSVADRFSKLYSPKKLTRTIARARYQRQLSARFLLFKKGLISLVPWFFAFLIVPALIFRHFEHWSFLDGFYYGFVTLSTIGFGDFVAGTSIERNYLWIYKIVVVFWIIFGLAYLSMVLNFITHSLRSRHISNVMQSLRLRMHSNNSFVSRMRRHRQDHHEHHPRRFKRQQSSPLVLFNQNNCKINGIDPHHHFKDHNEIFNNYIVNDAFPDKNNNNNSIKEERKQTNDIESSDNHGTSHRSKLWNIFRFWKSKKKLERSSNQIKNSLKCAVEQEPVTPATIRSANSLPDLSDVECMDPCCSSHGGSDSEEDAQMTMV